MNFDELPDSNTDSTFDSLPDEPSFLSKVGGAVSKGVDEITNVGKAAVSLSHPLITWPTAVVSGAVGGVAQKVNELVNPTGKPSTAGEAWSRSFEESQEKTAEMMKRFEPAENTVGEGIIKVVSPIFEQLSNEGRGFAQHIAHTWGIREGDLLWELAGVAGELKAFKLLYDAGKDVAAAKETVNQVAKGLAAKNVEGANKFIPLQEAPPTSFTGSTFIPVNAQAPVVSGPVVPVVDTTTARDVNARLTTLEELRLGEGLEDISGLAKLTVKEILDEKRSRDINTALLAQARRDQAGLAGIEIPRAVVIPKATAVPKSAFRAKENVPLKEPVTSFDRLPNVEATAGELVKDEGIIPTRTQVVLPQTPVSTFKAFVESKGIEWPIKATDPRYLELLKEFEESKKAAVAEDVPETIGAVEDAIESTPVKIAGYWDKPEVKPTPEVKTFDSLPDKANTPETSKIDIMAEPKAVMESDHLVIKPGTPEFTELSKAVYEISQKEKAGTATPEDLVRKRELYRLAGIEDKPVAVRTREDVQSELSDLRDTLKEQYTALKDAEGDAESQASIRDEIKDTKRELVKLNKELKSVKTTEAPVTPMQQYLRYRVLADVSNINSTPVPVIVEAVRGNLLTRAEGERILTILDNTDLMGKGTTPEKLAQDAKIPNLIDYNKQSIGFTEAPVTPAPLEVKQKKSKVTKTQATTEILPEPSGQTVLYAAVKVGNEIASSKVAGGLDTEVPLTESMLIAWNGGAKIEAGFVDQSGKWIGAKEGKVIRSQQLGEEAERRAQASLALESPETTKTPRGFVLRSQKGSIGKDVSLSVDSTRPFYSQLERIIRMKMGGKMPVDQLRKMLKGNGVTDAEINEITRGMEGVVTKQKVLEEIKVNGMKLEDVVLGEPLKPLSAIELKQKYADDFKELYDSYIDSGRDHDTAMRYAKEGTEIRANNREFYETSPVQYSNLVEPGAVPGSYREMFVTVPNAGKVGWGDAVAHAGYLHIENPIVRIRYNVREINGKKIGFIEEMQGPSAENQAKMPEALVKRIYDTGVKRFLALAKEEVWDGVAWTTGKMQVERYKLNKYIDSVTVIKDGNGYRVEGSKDGYVLVSKNAKDINELTNIIGKSLSSKATKDLQDLGEVRASSIYKSKILAEEVYNPTDGKLIAKRGEKYTDQSARKLYDAGIEKITFLEERNSMQFNKESLYSGGDRVSYSGLDLEVGGEGLKSVYDERLPKLFKKYGKEEIEKISIDIPEQLIGHPDGLLQYKTVPAKSVTVSYTPVTYNTPGSYTLYSGIDPTQLPSTLRNLVRTTGEGWQKLEESSRTVREISGGVNRSIQGLKEGLLSPKTIMQRDPMAKATFKELAYAEEAGNAFIYNHYNDYLRATQGIKKDSMTSANIGKALDGLIPPDELTKQERKAYDFMKQDYETLINSYARREAGSEEAYQKILRVVTATKQKGVAVSDLEANLKIAYDTLKAKQRDIRGAKKTSDLSVSERAEYADIKQRLQDILSKAFKKTLTEGEVNAYDVLSRKMSDYLPHLFDKNTLLIAFKDEVKDITAKLNRTTNSAVITKLKNRLNLLEDAVKKTEGGELITFRQLPANLSFRFFSPRTGKEGYSLDAMRAYETYLHGITRKIFDEPAVKTIKRDYFNKIDPSLKPYTQELVDYYLGKDRNKLDWLAGRITSFEWMRTLGLNPRSAIANFGQRINTVVYAGEKYALRAENMMLFDRQEANKIFAKSGVAREVPQVMAEGTMPQGMEKVRSIVGYMFNRVELGNRKHAYLTGYLKALEEGKKSGLAGEALEAKAQQFGINTVHKTQYRYGKLGSSKWARHGIGRVALQFTSYPIKTAEFLYDLAKNNPIAFMKYFAYTEGINYTAQELLDTDLSNALGFGITWGEALKVITSLAQGDTRTAWRHAKQTIQSGGGMLPSGFGPAVSSIGEIGVATTKGRGLEQVGKELTPVIANRLKQAYDAYKEGNDGEYLIKDSRKHPMYRVNARQLIQRTIGPKVAEESKSSKAYMETINLEKERKEVLSDIIDALLDDDINKAGGLIDKYEIAPSSQQLKNELIRRLTAREERLKIGKPERYQIQREGRLTIMPGK